MASLGCSTSPGSTSMSGKWQARPSWKRLASSANSSASSAPAQTTSIGVRTLSASQAATAADPLPAAPTTVARPLALSSCRNSCKAGNLPILVNAPGIVDGTGRVRRTASLN